MSNAMINEMINFCKFLGLLVLIVLLVVIIISIIESFIKNIIDRRREYKNADKIEELIINKLEKGEFSVVEPEKKEVKKIKKGQKKDSQ